MPRPSEVDRLSVLQGTDYVPMDRPGTLVANSTTLDDIRLFATTLMLTAAVALGGHRVVTMTGNYADCAALSHANSLAGITLGAVTMGQNVQVQTMGEITEPSWSWIVGQLVYLGNNGLLTQTPPTGAFLAVIARAITPTTLLIDMQPPLILA